MATNTYTALQTQVLGSAAASVTFSSIPQGYTDLQLIVNSTNSSGSAGISIRVGNGSIDSGSNYSLTYLAGDGSTAFSGRQSNVTSGYAGRDTTTNGIGIAHFMNYSNTTTYKTILARGNDSSYVFQYVNLWRSTAAINTITLYNDNSVNFATGSTFTLYGIASSDIPAYATGGYVSQDSTYWYHAFPMSGTFTPKQALTADILVVAGGGGGGSGTSVPSGGGGAGGVLAFSAQSLASGTAYTTTIGAGGSVGSNGGNSIFGSLTTCVGGGAGGVGTGGAGASGGSGGGGSAAGSSQGYSGTQPGGSATSGQGNAGGQGLGTNGAGGWAGGGGGASAAGSNGTTSNGGAGGNGLNTWASWLSATGYGVNGYIAGGGGGGVNNGTNGAGGLGGGGYGALASTFAAAGVANTGSGGGGFGNNGTTNAAAGGSGLIIVRYAK